MSALIATLRDNFEDNSTAAAWNASASASATVAETSGQARFTLPSSTAGSHLARYTSAHTYDLTGGSFYVNIQTMVATGVAAQAFFQLYLDGSNALQWIQLSGTLQAYSLVGGVQTSRYSAAWNATTYKYLRIRNSGGDILWESSTDGVSWTTRATLATPIAITDLYVDFGANCGNIASPGSFRLDEVNLVSLSTNWRWTQIVWPLSNRHKVNTLAIDTAGTVQGYVVTADGVDVNGDPSGNVRYWSGPCDSGRLLTEQASDAAAKAMAVDLPLDGRFDLPTIVEARCIRIYHRSIDGAGYTLREVYPRRLVQADDIEAESITTLLLAAGAVTADKITVDQLSAITADCGTLTAGVIDGVTIYAGSSNEVTLDSGGVELAARTVAEYTGASTAPNAVSWTIGGETIGSIEAYYDAGSTAILTIAASSASYLGKVSITSKTQSGLFIGNGSAQQISVLSPDTATVKSTTINLDGDAHAFADLSIDDGLNVGTASGAGIGQVLASGSITSQVSLNTAVNDAATSTPSAVVTLGHNSTGTPAAGFGADIAVNLETTTTVDTSAVLIRTTWVTATHASRAARIRFFVYDTAARTVMDLEASGSAPMIGFLGAAAVARQSIGAAAPAGGTGAAAGAYDTAAHRDALITLVNNIRSALITNGLCTT